MSKKPSFRAYVVEGSNSDDSKARWTEIGAVWPHKNGNGFDLVIHTQLAVSGRIVCIEPRESAASE